MNIKDLYLKLTDAYSDDNLNRSLLKYSMSPQLFVGKYERFCLTPTLKIISSQ